MDKPLLIQYDLKDGGLIYVFCEQAVAYVNTPLDNPVFLTGAPANIVKALLDQPGKVVSYESLYNACYGDVGLPPKYINNIQQHVYSLPDPLRQKKIKNHSVKRAKKASLKKAKKKDENNIEPAGYSLEVKRITPIYQNLDNLKNTLPLKFNHLAGEYIALYPNPKKPNKLLGAFIQIRKHDEDLDVNAIFDIPTNKALERVLELFPGESNFSEPIAKIQPDIPAINIASWFTGVLKNEEQHIATLMLKSILANDKRNIVLDISDFLKNPDRELIEERNQYRGGLGLVVGGGRTDYGFTAHRIALIRTSWYNISSMGLDSNELPHYLKSTNFVNITSDLDSAFYLWILRKDKEQQAKMQCQKEGAN